MLTRRNVLRAFAALSFGTTALGGYAVALEPMGTRVTRWRFKPSSWPAGLRLKIAAIADIHAGEPQMSAERIAAIAEEANRLSPDLIVLLGDYTAGHRFITKEVPHDAWAEACSVLRAPLGVHAVLGNHDWWDDAAAQARGRGPVAARTALERRGIPVYENDAVRLSKDGRPFWLAGLGDQLALARRRANGRRRFIGVDDLPRTLAAITDDAPAILLAHEPDIFATLPSRFALTLAGHTHGGQVRIAGFAPIVPSRSPRRYAYGHVVERAADGGEKHLVVSGGLGCSILPVRLGCPPEIVVVEVG